jgi:hypothetical protein
MELFHLEKNHLFRYNPQSKVLEPNVLKFVYDILYLMMTFLC